LYIKSEPQCCNEISSETLKYLDIDNSDVVCRRCATLDDSRHSQRKQEENSQGTLIFGELPAVPKSVSPSEALE
jgi:hypothetical protein